MKRLKRIVKWFLMGAMLAAPLFCSALAAAEKPNIIVIMTDDMGYSDLGCDGGEIETPNLDMLANNGIRAEIKSIQDTTCTILYDGKEVKIPVNKGKTYVLDGSLNLANH